jgi:hypothetical protein
MVMDDCKDITIEHILSTASTTCTTSRPSTPTLRQLQGRRLGEHAV